jgi:hypothetical protein
MPTSKVTPKVIARTALRFLIFLLDKALQAIIKLAFNTIGDTKFDFS